MKIYFKFLLPILILTLYIWISLIFTSNGIFFYFQKKDIETLYIKNINEKQLKYRDIEKKLQAIKDQSPDYLDQLIKEKFNLCKKNEREWFFT